MTTVQQAAAWLAHETDQADARIRDLDRLLVLLAPLAGARGPLWWTLRRLPPDQRAEARALLDSIQGAATR
jgi:hypothetical protein